MTFSLFAQPEEPLDPELVRIRELDKKIADLNAKIEAFQENAIRPVTSKLEGLDKAKKEADQSLNKNTEDLKKMYAKMVNDLYLDHEESTKALKTEAAQTREILYQLQDEFGNIKAELNSLSKEQKKLLADRAAKETLDAIEKKLAVFLSTLKSQWPEFDKYGDPIDFMPFQLDDLKKLIAAFESGMPGVLNANEMGLGKTLESIAFDHCVQHLFYEKYGYRPKVLWITKSSLIATTCQEFVQWNPGRAIMPVLGSWKKEQRETVLSWGIAQNAVVVCNYETINTTPGFMDIDWDIIYCDEVHKLKGGHLSKPTQVWQNVKALVSKAKFFVPMSGSPIQNEPGEMWSYLHIFDPIRFPKASRFKDEYCYGWGQGVTVDFNRLIKVMGNQVIRHRKDEVITDLPDKTRRFVPLTMGEAQREIYDQMKNNFFLFLDDNKENMIQASVTIEWLTRLRQIALFPAGVKMKDPMGNDKPIPLSCRESIVVDECLDIVEELLNENKRAVVFTAQFVDVLYELEARFNERFAGQTFTELAPDGTHTFPVKCMVLDGSTKMNNAEVQALFNAGEVQVVFCNRMSHGEGLNLQAAQDVIMLDRWWNPEGNKQCEDRCWRIGQKNAVTIHYLDVQDSVYQFVQAKVESKDQMIENIMEDASLRKTGADLKDFLKDLL